MRVSSRYIHVNQYNMKFQFKNFDERFFITFLRAAIGWHFLYEGATKFFQESWSSSGFLLHTSGFFSPFYHWLASTPFLLHTTDLLNMYGLTLIGIALFTGLPLPPQVPTPPASAAQWACVCRCRTQPT